MPSDTEALLLYSPRLRAWCEAMVEVWQSGGPTFQAKADAARLALCGMEELAAEWISHRSLDRGPAASRVRHYAYYVALLTPPAPETPRD